MFKSISAVERKGHANPEGGLPYKNDGDAPRKIKIKLLPLEGRSMWVWLKLKLAPKRDFCVVRVTAYKTYEYFPVTFISTPGLQTSFGSSLFQLLR